MTGRDERKPGGDRADRLAEALRDNLKRRKAQARARREPPMDGDQTDPDATAGAPKTDPDGKSRAT